MPSTEPTAAAVRAEMVLKPLRPLVMQAHTLGSLGHQVIIVRSVKPFAFLTYLLHDLFGEVSFWLKGRGSTERSLHTLPGFRALPVFACEGWWGLSSGRTAP